MKKTILLFSLFFVCELAYCQVNENKEKASIAMELGKFDIALSYLDVIPENQQDDKIKSMKTICTDSIVTRTLVVCNQLLKVQKYKEALALISKKIPQRYMSREAITSLVDKCYQFIILQKAGKIVSRELAQKCKEYDQLYSFHYGYARGTKKRGDGDENDYFITKHGKLLFEGRYWYDFSDGFSCHSSSVCYTDSLGQQMPWDLKLHYDWGENFHEGRAAVLNEKKAKWGFIDKNGILVIPAIYDKVYFFSEGLAFVKKKGKYFYIDLDGNIKIDKILPSNNLNFHFSDGIAWIWDKKKGYVAIDKSGHHLFNIDEFYRYKVDAFHDGLSRIEKRAYKDFKDIYTYGFIDKIGAQVIDFKYDDAKNFSEKIAAVKSGNKWGMIDAKGKLIIPLVYDDIKSSSEGLVAVKNKGKWGFVNHDGKEVIPCKYDEVESFSEDFAVVRIKNNYGYIDKYNNCTLNYNFE